MSDHKPRRIFRLTAAVLLALPVGATLSSSAAVGDANEAADASIVDLERRVSAGNLHSCAILDTGQVRCWGGNDNGQLGNGTTTTSTAPVLVPGLSAVLQVSAGGSHTCTLLHGGTIRCWGLNGNGQLGNGTTANSLVPVAVTGVSGAKAVAAGGFHTCAVLGDGTVRCWGNDAMGQVGDASAGDTSSAPAAVSGITAANPAKALSLGEFHSCALLTDGAVRCWGHNGFGQLGDGTTGDRSTATAVAGLPDPTVDPALVLSTGSSHTCVLLDDDDRTVRCWGHNAYGSLGHATAVVDSVMQPSSSPLVVRFDDNPDPLVEHLVPLTGSTALTSGQYHTCARGSGGGVRCWGNNNRGQLGADPKPLTGELEDSVNALAVGGLGAAGAVTAGGFHTCALVGTAMRCWGYNFFGQLGGYAASSHRPVQVTALTGATAVATGTEFACALINADTTDKPVCWGSNTDGRLGAGLGVTGTTIRVPVTGIASADALDAGNGHACALPATSGAPRCWGLGANGQLGNAATAASSTPVAVAGLTTATTVAGGGTLGTAERGMTCARRTDGKVSCWGRNADGQLGDGTTTDRSTPVTVQVDTDPDPGSTVLADLTNVATVVTGGLHTCALVTDSSVRCWGFNGSGQLGDATTTGRHTAVRVQVDTDPDVDAPLTGVVALAAGANHTCARLSDDSVRCWGDNGSGQLGDGTNSDRHLPTAVPGFDGSTLDRQAKLLTAGDVHTCATRADGGLSCWGENGDGQLGDGSTSDSTTPVAAYGPAPAEANPFITAISGSRRNTCARLVDTSVTCWGDNSRGQLGDGIGPASLAPVAVTSLPALGTNHIPNPADDSATTSPGVAVTVNVLANDTDADGDTLTVTAVGAPAHGGAVNNGDGTVTYTPDAGFCGDDTFTYAVSDGTATVPASVNVAMNCPPVAVNDAATTAEDTAVAVSVLANDTDPDGDTLTVTAAGDPPRGATSFNATTVTYTPDGNECGPPADTFSYTVSDGHGHTASAAVTVTVTCANDGPDAVDDAATTAENTPVTVNVLANDTDVDGNTLSLSSVGAASHGTAAANGTAVDYTPTAGYCGPDSFTYVASDGALTDTATVTVSVTCVADSPQAVDDVKTTAEDTAVSVPVLANDTDPDGDTLSVQSVTDPPHGTAAIDGTSVTYTPGANFCGNDTFSYVASDGSLTGSATVTVTVTCVNDAPVTVDDAATTPEDTNIHIHVLANDSDPDGDTLTPVSVTDPPHGMAGIAADALTYTPDANYCGSDTFDYTVRDPSGATATGHVFVTVTCVNDAPVIQPVANKTTRWGDAVTQLLSADDVDAGDTATFALVTGPVGATVSPAGGFSWTPTDSQVGVHPVTVKVTDAAGASSQTSFTVTVSKRPVTVVYSGASSGQYSDPTAVSATLTDTATGAPVPGRTVSFTIGVLAASTTTGAGGVASTSMLLLGPVGPTSMSTVFAGDAAYLSASDSDPFTVAKESVTARLTGAHLTLAASAPVSLSASVTEEADGFLGSALASVQVTFRQVGGAVLCTVPVSVTGPGTGTATCSTGALGSASRAVIVSVSGPAYTGLVDVSAFTVAAPGTGDAAGSGQVGAGDAFGFRAVDPRKGAPTGDVVHVFVSGGTAYVVQSATLTSLTRSCTGGNPKVCTVTVAASGATTSAVDLLTGLVSAVPGTSAVRVDATDAAEPSGGALPADKYAVAITGATSYALGTPGSQLLVNVGNVRVPS
ncbi:MAG TPA: tandem-95 repeat protein [Micromonosporaceae bacterium]|nr:tandem-95 repeat protein [Micromonosporaceae bacterium]